MATEVSADPLGDEWKVCSDIHTLMSFILDVTLLVYI